MLHLICYDDSKDDITCFAIDFFNDVTGMDGNAFRLYDVQSKGSDASAKALGEDLVTLYKNYVSDFKGFFVKQILFVRRVTGAVFEDTELSEFRYKDMKEEARRAVRSALVETCKAKTYIADSAIDDEEIDSFLQSVLFVVSKPDCEDYIRPLIKDSVKLGARDSDLRAIFNEVRKKQVGIKSNSKVEGIELSHPDEVFKYNRVLKRSDIILLAIARIINTNPLTQGVPRPFLPIYNGIEPDEADGFLEDCQNDLAKQMCSVNESAAFWRLLAEIVTVIHSNPDADIGSIYHSIKPDVLEGCSQLNAMSHQYFIAIVKEGLKVD